MAVNKLLKMGSGVRILSKSIVIVSTIYFIVFCILHAYLLDSENFIFDFSKNAKRSTGDQHSTDNQTLSGIFKNGYSSLKAERIHLTPVHIPVAVRKWSEPNVLLGSYLKDRIQLCDGSFEGFGNIFAVLKNVSLDPSRGRGKIGGENITDVINQNEKDEYYRLSKGYFNLPCPYSKSLVTSYKFSNKDHLQNWMQAINFHTSLPLPSRRIEEPTICVQRYEYAHVYFTMLDIYNVFLVCNMFYLDPLSVTILWIDGHPKSEMEDIWTKLFKRVTRAGDIKEPVTISTLFWNIMGYNSPMHNNELKKIPLLEEFRKFVISSYNIEEVRKLNCSSVRVMFIWRRNYVAHPRNPQGRVQRKIQNEKELETSLKSKFSSLSIRGLQLDTYSMREQLEFVTDTDIMIGMHGAGLVHSLFLPPHGALVELFPNQLSRLTHFRSIALWHGLKYKSWFNNAIFAAEITYVDPVVVNDIVNDLLKEMCSDK